jgi:arsenate reductase (thioredoxin)
MTEKSYQVLFLSQRNSARSILAEAILNSLGSGKFHAFSAGVRPVKQVDPIAIEILQHAALPTEHLRPKHYREFAQQTSAPIDFVFTLSDTAAGEPLPEWPGLPITAHWPSQDPTLLNDEVERRLALIRTRAELENRLRIFVSLPFASLDRLSTQKHLEDIGKPSHPA